MKTEYYVTYIYPGSFFSEESTSKLKSHSVAEAVENLPQGAFAFTLHDIQIRTGILEDNETITHTKKVNESGRFYPGGKKYTLADIEAEFGKDSILYGNIQQYDYPVAVKTRRGNFQPMSKEDVILP